MAKHMKDVSRSDDIYDVRSKERLKKNMERKFKKLFGTALYQFETMLRTEIEQNPELHREFKSEIFRVGNRIIQNMKTELDCYNIEYIPFHIEFRADDQLSGEAAREKHNED